MNVFSVAPLVGAWIETFVTFIFYPPLLVAPLVGAWIETQDALKYIKRDVSHPSWVRGLKQEQP